jgi:hypothetical protein
MVWHGRVAAGRDAVHCFDVEARVEENRGSHNAGARGGPLATTQEHCEGDDDAIEGDLVVDKGELE